MNPCLALGLGLLIWSASVDSLAQHSRGRAQACAESVRQCLAPLEAQSRELFVPAAVIIANGNPTGLIVVRYNTNLSNHFTERPSLT